MKVKSLIKAIGFISPLVMLGLVSCGGGNDVASSGATAVSAAAKPTTSPTTLTEPKINGQIDERTGVAPVVAQAGIAPTLDLCLRSRTYGGSFVPLTTFTTPTFNACRDLLPNYAFAPEGQDWTTQSNGGCLKSVTWKSPRGITLALTANEENLCRTAADALYTEVTLSNQAVIKSNGNQCALFGGFWTQQDELHYKCFPS